MSDNAGMSGFQQGVSGAMAKLGVGEKFAVLGALGVLVVWLLFDLLIDEYSIGHMPFALALVIAYSAYRYHMTSESTWAVPYGTVVFGCAGILGILGAWSFIEEMRSDILDTDGSTVIGAIGFWAASILAGVGALQMKMSRG